MQGSLVSSLAEINRMRTVALSEYNETVTDQRVDNALWNVKLFQYAGNLLSSVGGGAILVPERMNKMQSALGGAFAGAALGAKIGTAIAPGIGSAIGAGIGGILGYQPG